MFFKFIHVRRIVETLYSSSAQSEPFTGVRRDEEARDPIVLEKTGLCPNVESRVKDA